MEFKQFFDELSSRLKASEDLDRELDQRLAHRFNVFDYLQDDELGLSRIIADLLDPKASHGQGKTFLWTLLGLVGPKSRRELPGLVGSQNSVVVKREWRIPSGRQIDISIRIDGDDGKPYCLAIENKPYARDQYGQVRDYLKYLSEKFERFLLIYMSPTGQGPSEESISKTEIKEWKEHFAIMPYFRGQEGHADKTYDNYCIPHSLADWFQACQANCNVDRLRWFLREAETFCRLRFGGQPMTSSAERKAASDYVFSTPRHLKTALAVYESWPDVVDRVCKRFLEELRCRIESSAKEHKELKQFANDMPVKVNYKNRAGAWESSLWLYRESWTPYPSEKQGIGRTCIVLQNAGPGPRKWEIGVCSPIPKSRMDDKYREQRCRLNVELERAFGRGKETDNCPRWLTLAADKRNWDTLVPDLHRENENQDGEIMRYFVDQFIDVAAKAIPIINRIEGPKGDN